PLPRRNPREEILIVAIGERRELWHQSTSRGSQFHILKAAVPLRLGAAHQTLVDQAVDQFRYRPPSQTRRGGESPGRGLPEVEKLPEDDPFGDRRTAPGELAREAVRHMIGHKPQPKAGMALESTHIIGGPDLHDRYSSFLHNYCQGY